MELLERDMTYQEIKEYLMGNIAKSWENDIAPILSSGHSGFFALPREFFCYCDFLGSFYYGLNGRDARSGARVRQAAEMYLDEILGEIDNGYRDHRALLYTMYRHGTVHAYQPKTLENSTDGRIISWLPYRGAREQWQYLEHKVVEIRHLLPCTLDNNVYRMPVSIDCLYWDLIESIKKYVDMIDTQNQSRNNTLIQNFNQFRSFLTTFESTTLTW